MKIIDGKALASKVKKEVKNKLQDDKYPGEYPPQLAVIQVGNDPASDIYINNKKKACEEVGIIFTHYQYEEDITTERLKSAVRNINSFKSTTAILIQLPLPEHIDIDEVMEEIDPIKDVDGFTTTQAGMLQLGKKNENRLEPCTAKGIIRLLKSVTYLQGKTATVVGRSNIVGKPVAQLLQENDVTVSLCHSKTPIIEIERLISGSDIVVLGVGSPKYFGSRYFTNNHIHRLSSPKFIIDAGINRDENGKLCGDLNVEDIKPLNLSSDLYYTPVPGGVGPMTVAELIDNIYLSYEAQYNKGVFKRLFDL